MIDQWRLQRSEIRDLVSLRQLTGMVANSASGRLIGLMGVRLFAAVATLSELLYWVGFSHSHWAALICAVLGWLGPARALSANTMLTAEGARLGIAQARLAVGTLCRTSPSYALIQAPSVPSHLMRSPAAGV